MAAHIEGKTINELARIDDITGQEIIPLAVLNEETGAYVTRGITIDNLFKVIYSKIQEAEQQTADVASEMSSYVAYLTSVDNKLSYNDKHLEEELVKTNTYVSYNAEGIVDIHNELKDLESYTTYNVGYIYDHLGDESYIIDELTESINIEKGRNDAQDDTINSYGNALDDHEERLSYESYRNNIQDREIKTIYVENSKDAFNDYSNPDDDNVNPDLDPDLLFGHWEG